MANRFFYLLAEGSAAKTFNNVEHFAALCSGPALVGITRDVAAKIWFRATVMYMTAGTNYAGARVATLKAAADLHGSASTQYKAVAAAWSAVNVN